MRNTNTNPRRELFKKLPLAIISLSTFSLFKFKKTSNSSEFFFKIMSKREADNIIKNEKFSSSTSLNPAPAPTAPKNIKV